ncbi:MAG: hypothetical protein WBM83_09885 [Flavobacteriaceae bacterium]
MNLKQIHYISGLTITVFVALHLFNHAISIYGPEAHIETMEVLRVFYRNIIVESLLLLAVLVQIISGLKLFFDHRSRASTFFEKLHIWSGFYLAFFFLFHVGAVMAGRYLLELDTNFYFGVAGLNTFPLSLFFTPYYGLAIISFFAHIASVPRLKMKNTMLGVSVTAQSYTIFIFGVLITIFILYGLTGGFEGIPIPDAYNNIIGK